MIFDSGKDVKILFFLLVFYCLLPAQSLHNRQIEKIFFRFNNSSEIKNTTKYKSLINIKEGKFYNANDVRESLQNLYKTGSFSQIEVKVEIQANGKLHVYFFTRNKYMIKTISVMQNIAEKKKGIKKAIFSLHENAYLEESKIASAIRELKDFLKQRGYNNSDIRYRLTKNKRKLIASLKFIVKNNELTRINNLTLSVSNPVFYQTMLRKFDQKYYIPVKFQKQLDKIRKNLQKKRYYFPEIVLKETYLDKKKSSVDLDISIKLGFRYIFIFRGIKRKMNLISTIWGKRVFEKWAEEESRARILHYLKNKGYLDARVDSDIQISDSIKTITFSVKKNKKYTLGNINFSGNRIFSDKKLKEIVKTDNLIYDRLFGLRSGNLSLDLEVIKLLYYFSGFPFSKITLKPEFHANRADIHFIIQEGEKTTVNSLRLKGNKSFQPARLLSLLKTRENQPYILQTLNQDIEKLKYFYHQNGFDDIQINLEISPGNSKSILIQINEGKSYRMWNLIIIGASNDQAKLIRKLFPLKKNAFFNQNRINQFKSELETSSIFSEFKVIKLKKTPDIIDVLIKVIPDYSKYYGFGIGWEDRKKFRGTLEYQERNIFKSYSTLSAILQIGFSEKRGVLSYDTPYFFNRNMNSSFRIWDEDEIYPSYKFSRFGIGESIIKKISPQSYIVSSLSWYRTKLTELSVTEEGLDRLNDPFDTTALSLSYVMEKRDDPFNPLQGDFFSTNLKIGLPFFEKDYSFFKFFWSYQKNIRLFKRSSLAFSIRNGFATGEMSITERFFAGGIHSFRGTKNDRLGPLDPETSESRGGNALFLFNFEATFPFFAFPIEDLYYSVFADVGNVFGAVREFSLNNLEKAVGFGIKYKTPFGPLRIDLAWNLNPEVADTFLIQIGIGNVF